jgi:hypothetical protein
MAKYAVIVVTLVAALSTATADLQACGDKYLRVGHSARRRGYAAVHPASILVYKPKNATAKGVKEFDALLKRAGHKPVFLQNGTDLAPAVAAGRYDLVIAAYADAGAIRQQLQSIAGRPDIVPVLDEPTKALAAEAAKEYHCLITPRSMTKYDALAEIDHAMEVRLKGTSAGIK